LLTSRTLNRSKDATGDLIAAVSCTKFRVIAERIIWCVCTAIFDLVTVIHGTVDSVITGVTGGRTVTHCIAELSAGTEQSVIRTIGVIWCVNTHVTCFITGVVGTANAVITDDRCSCLTGTRAVTGLVTVAEQTVVT
jgi:hypothetical protein